MLIEQVNKLGWSAEMVLIGSLPLRQVFYTRTTNGNESKNFHIARVLPAENCDRENSGPISINISLSLSVGLQ